MTAVFHRGGDATRMVMLLDRRWWYKLAFVSLCFVSAIAESSRIDFDSVLLKAELSLGVLCSEPDLTGPDKAGPYFKVVNDSKDETKNIWKKDILK